MSDTTTVYRLEHTKVNKMGVGYGPYVSSLYPHSADLCVAHDNIDHPNVYIDVKDHNGDVMGLFGWRHFHYCACMSLDNLVVWFDEWLESILLFGFEVVEYVVPTENVFFGEYQCAFDGTEIISKKIVTDLVVPK